MPYFPQKFFLFILFFSSTFLFAQSRQKVGVALGGGAARGYFHLGVLEVLEENGIDVEVVTGVSVGSQVGALYALGYRPREILELFSSLNYIDLFDDKRLRPRSDMRYKLHPWNQTFSIKDDFNPNNDMQRSVFSLFSAKGVESYFDNIYWEAGFYEDFTKFPRIFGAVAYNADADRQETITRGSLSKAVRASISLPLFMPPTYGEGQAYIDGGVVNNIPIREAYALGATKVIAIDISLNTAKTYSGKGLVGKLLDSFLNDRIIGDEALKKEADLVIEMSAEPIYYSVLNFNKAKEIYELGREKALEYLPQLEQFKSNDYVPKVRAKFDDVIIEKIEVIGTENKAYLRQIIGLKEGQKLTRKRLKIISDKVINDFYFKKIGIYHLGNILYLDVIEDTGYKVGINASYTSDFGPNVGTSVALKDLSNNSATYFRFDVNYQQGLLTTGHLYIASSYTPWLNFTTSWFINDNFGTNGSNSPDSFIVPSKDIANTYMVQGGISLLPHPVIMMGVNYKYTYINTKGLDDTSFYNNIQSEQSTAIVERLIVDLNNDQRFPSKGFYFDLNMEQGVAPIDRFDYNRILLTSTGSFRLGSGISTTIGTQVGSIMGSNIPQSAYFGVGGFSSHTYSNQIDLPAFDVNDFKAQSVWLLKGSLMYTYMSRFNFIFVDYRGAFLNDSKVIELNMANFEQSLGFRMAIDMTRFVFEWGVAWDFDDAVPNFNILLGNAF